MDEQNIPTPLPRPGKRRQRPKSKHISTLPPELPEQPSIETASQAIDRDSSRPTTRLRPRPHRQVNTTSSNLPPDQSVKQSIQKLESPSQSQPQTVHSRNKAGSQHQPTNGPTKPHFDRNAWLKQGTGELVETIDKDNLQPSSIHVDRASGFDLLCSYNWHNAPKPSIYVPGAPPKWTPSDVPITLPPDSGAYYIDQNAHHAPDHPFEPMFRAISIMKPGVDFDKVDLLANRNSMRKLLGFCMGTTREPFRIDLNVVNKTLVLTRRERRTRETVGGSHTNAGFGHNFESHFTTAQPGLEDSTGHHRVARYKLGDLESVIRYEVDAWMPNSPVDKVGQVGSNAQAAQLDDSEDLLVSLKNLSLTAQNPPATKLKNSSRAMRQETQVVRRGSAVDCTELAELKSKAVYARKRDLIPQLWFGRIPFLALGVHDKGVFTHVSVTDTAEDFQRFEVDQQENLQKLVSLLKLLKNAAMSTTKKACVVLCEPPFKPLKLRIYTSTKVKAVLPDDLIKEFWGQET